MAIKLSLALRPYTPEWRNNRELPLEEQVRLTYRTLTMQDTFALQESTGINLLTGFDSGGDADQVKKQWNMIETIISEHTEGWENVQQDDTALSAGADITRYGGLMLIDLMSEVVNEVLTASMGSNDDQGNSLPPSESSNSDNDVAADVVPS
jgi:hypothetical protein